MRIIIVRLVIALGLLIVSLGFGILGYHYYGKLPWLDAFLNASMILSGMGPVDRMMTDKGKYFSSFYAIYSGTFFLVVIALIIDAVVET
jgi:hypothetical protein